MSTNKLGTALITGASTGIGATYADRLARRGYDLILVARDQARLEELATRLRRETGVAVDIVRADLTDPADLARIEQRLQHDPAITMLVNNAGMTVAGTMFDVDPDRLESMIKLNVTAPTRLARAALPALAARGNGTLINLASVVALSPGLAGGTYSATKAYMLTLTEALQKEAGERVRVQAVLPGATRTEIWERGGIDIAKFPPEMVMEVGEMVDAALAGLDQGELITIPALPDAADWSAFTTARQHLGPNLSRNHAADRYKAS
jgi:short-subunit dehydrogenase